MGGILNIRYLEIVDFLLGWTTFDLAGDDGHPYGKWPWQKDDSGNLPDRLLLDAASAGDAP